MARQARRTKPILGEESGGRIVRRSASVKAIHALEPVLTAGARAGAACVANHTKDAFAFD